MSTTYSKKSPRLGGESRFATKEKARTCAPAASNIHSRQSRHKPARKMLEHLLDFEPSAATLREVTPVEKALPDDLLSAQLDTASWLEQMGAPTADTAAQAAATAAAQQAFSTITAAQPPAKQRAALVQVKTPEAVRHLTGMLTAYDWEFVQQAKELRGYAVAQILEETKNPDARIRLKALDMLGRVTEVALFTERVEVKNTSLSDEDIDARIREKLARFAGVVDAEVVDATPTPPQEPASA